MFNKKLYIHIGRGKTGTTALQKFLMLNSEQLYKRYGILYSDYNLESYNHTALFFDILKKVLLDNGMEALSTCLGERSDPGVFFNKIEAKATKAKAIVLSSEFFASTGVGALNVFGQGKDIAPELDLKIKNEIIKTVYEATKKFDVKIVYYMRRQDLFIESLYNQRMKVCDLEMTFDEFFDYLMERQSLDDYKILQNWAKYFGKKKIIVRPYDIIKTMGVERDFIQNVMGKSIENFTEIKTAENERLSRDIIEYKLKNFSKMDKYQKEICETIQYLNTTCADKTPYAFLSIEKRMKLIESVNDSNRKILKEYLKSSEAITYEMNEVFPDYPGLSEEKELEITQKILKYWFEKDRKACEKIDEE